MAKLLKLIQNEWMKLWNKKATWVMVALLVLLTAGMMGITKWVELQNDSFNAQSGNGAFEISVESEIEEWTWQDSVESELSFTQDKLAYPSLSKAERTKLEGQEKVYLYRLDHSIEPLAAYDRDRIMMDSSGIGGTVLLLTVIVAAGIVASEFSQGTIKMLLSRPVKRWKILTSKFMTVNLFGILLMLVGYVVIILCAFIFFQTGDGQALVWNGKEVVEASVWGKSLYMLLLSFGSVFVTSTFAFMIGSVFRSSSLAIGLSIFIYFTGSTIVMLLSKYEIAKYIVFTHLDLTQFETGHQLIEGITMPFSLAVLAVYVVVFLVISYATFMKRDITA